jgi:hypothetical protein
MIKMKRLDLFYSLTILTQLVTETTNQRLKSPISFALFDADSMTVWDRKHWVLAGFL